MHIPTFDPSASLRISEIFYSLQGEALTSGAPTIFVRLTGCPLRCVYCDTAYAFTGGQKMSLETILEAIATYPCRRICVTGGEPLAQKSCLDLLHALTKEGYQVSLETSGALDVANVPRSVSKVMDLKTPSSQEEGRNLWDNVAHLTQHDQIKIVIQDRADYDWALDKIRVYNLIAKVGVLWLSPMFVVDAGNKAVSTPDIARDLAQWMLEDALDVRLQLQLHKLIWQDAKGK